MSAPRKSKFINTLSTIKKFLTKNKSEEVELPSIETQSFQKFEDKKVENKENHTSAVTRKKSLRFAAESSEKSSSISEETLESVIAQKDKKDNKYPFYNLLQQHINEKYPDLDPKIKLRIFKFVDAELKVLTSSPDFKLGDNDNASEQEKEDIAIIKAQIQAKTSKFFSRLGLDQNYLLNVRSQIPDIIKELGFMQKFKASENILASRLYERIQAAYASQGLLSNETEVKDFIKNEISKFFNPPNNSPADQYIEEYNKKNLDNMVEEATSVAIETLLEQHGYGQYHDELKPLILKSLGDSIKSASISEQSDLKSPTLKRDIEGYITNRVNRDIITHKSDPEREHIVHQWVPARLNK